MVDTIIITELSFKALTLLISTVTNENEKLFVKMKGVQKSLYLTGPGVEI